MEGYKGLYKDQRNGNYYIDRKIKGKRYKFSLRISDKRLAIDMYLEFIRQVYQPVILKHIPVSPFLPPGANTNVYTDSPPLTKHFKSYYKTYELKNVTKRTLSLKQQVYDMLGEAGVKTYADVDQDHMNIFIYNLNEHYQSGDSIRKMVQELKCFLNYSARNWKKTGFTKEDYNALDLPVDKPTQVRTTILSDDQLTLIFTHLRMKGDHDFIFYLQTLLHTYCRPAEVVPLKVSFYNRESGIASIYMPKKRHVKDERKRWKKLPLSDEYVGMLESYFRKYNLSPDDFLFRGASSGDQFYGKKFSKLKKTLELPLGRNDGLYVLRHTACTRLWNKTKDIDLCSKMAGNSPKVFMEHYVNNTVEDYKQMLDDK